MRRSLDINEIGAKLNSLIGSNDVELTPEKIKLWMQTNPQCGENRSYLVRKYYCKFEQRYLIVFLKLIAIDLDYFVVYEHDDRGTVLSAWHIFEWVRIENLVKEIIKSYQQQNLVA